MRITPYTAQVVYMESRRMADKEINLETFLLRCDLFNIKKFTKIDESELSQYQVITTCLMEVIKLDKVINESPNAMVNYMRGINSGIKSTDNILRYHGEVPMEYYLSMKGFGSNPVIKYIFLTLTGRYDVRNEMDKAILKDYLVRNKVGKKLPALDGILNDLNKELKQIEEVLKTKDSVKADIDLMEIENTVERIKKALNEKESKVEITGTENITKLNEKLFGLLKEAQKQEQISVDVSTKLNDTLSRYEDTINTIDSSLKRSNTTMKHTLQGQKESLERLDTNKSEVEKSLKEARENFEQLSQLQKDIDIQGLINDVDKIVNTNKRLKESTSDHASLLQGVTVRIVHIQKSMLILEEVLENLNRLTRREAVLGLSKAESQVNKITNNIGGM